MKSTYSAYYKHYHFILALVLLVPLAGCSSLGLKSSSQSFKIPAYEVEKTKEGVEIFLFKDSKLPTYSMNVMFDFGSASDPVGRKGLGEFVFSMLLKGAGKRNREELSEEIEFLGASSDVNVSYDYTTFGISALSKNSPHVIEIMSEILGKPTFPDKEVELHKKHTMALIKQIDDSPDQYSWKMFRRFFFAGHPYEYSSTGEVADLQGVTRQEVVEYYKNYIGWKNAKFFVVGDFKKETILEEIQKIVNGWHEGVNSNPGFEKYPDAEIAGVEIVLHRKKDLTQTWIVAGGKGISRRNPDYLGLRMIGEIAGGGFTSRLMKKLRVEKGLTYGIYSYFWNMYDRGAFVVSTYSKNGSAPGAVSEILGVLKELREKGVEPEEITGAKAYMAGIFPKIIETPEKLAFNVMYLNRYGISNDYLQNFIENVNAIKKEEIEELLKKHINPGKMRILLYGNPDNPKQLEKFGSLKIIDL